MTAPLVEAHELRKRFGGVQAVDGISLSVAAQEIFAIIGPNGAGKSTMLNLLSGVFQPDAGRLVFAGRSLIGMPSFRRAQLGLARTFQKIRLFKHLSVLENVLVGFHMQHRMPTWQYILPGDARRRDEARCRGAAHELLSFVGLEGRWDVRAGALPYGQQRMLEIARALATDPKLLLLDEPAAGLNGSEVEFLVGQLVELRSRGLAMIVVEHNMDLVMTVADRVLVMDHGQHLFSGSSKDAQSDPRVIAAYLGGEAA